MLYRVQSPNANIHKAVKQELLGAGANITIDRPNQFVMGVEDIADRAEIAVRKMGATVRQDDQQTPELRR